MVYKHKQQFPSTQWAKIVNRILYKMEHNLVVGIEDFIVSIENDDNFETWLRFLKLRFPSVDSLLKFLGRVRYAGASGVNRVWQSAI